MWLVIKNLYTNVKAKVLYEGALSREIDILQDTGQGRILAPFMYQVYINSLLKVLTDHCYAISINRLSLPSPSFADDISPLALYPSFLETFMNICHTYSKTWRYEFNHTKSAVVTFGETKPIHSQLMREVRMDVRGFCCYRRTIRIQKSWGIEKLYELVCLKCRS